MSVNPLRKNKINLHDYPYQKDIEYRILMAELSVFEVDVLIEILHSSLKISNPHLAEALEVDEAELLLTLEKLQKLKLYRLENETILVNKEMRKYYESQIPKFDDDFRADMEFLRGLLSKVPIHVLPIWYSISRTSDDIFSSILENYLHTPKVYQRYLDESSFDEPELNQIVADVYSAPDFKVRAKTLIEKYSLTREKFEEFMLLLEFNLVCCLSYNQSDDQWEEVITPFYEWRKYLRYIRDSVPKPIENTINIQRTHPSDFGFVQDMTKMLSEALTKPIPLVSHDGAFTLPKKVASRILSHFDSHMVTDEYLSQLIKKFQQLQLAEVKNNTLQPRRIANAWLDKHLQEQAMAVYRYGSPHSKAVPGDYIDRNLRETEKSLKRIVNIGWIYFEDFTKACTAPIGANKPVSLQRKGKRWKYQLPEFTQEDISTLHHYIFLNLFQAGMVATGTHNGSLCFCVTPFGRMSLD